MAKKTTTKKDGYKATDSFKATFTNNTIGVSDVIYKALTNGDVVDLADVPDKVVNYLKVNGFLVK